MQKTNGLKKQLTCLRAFNAKKVDGMKTMTVTKLLDKQAWDTRSLLFRPPGLLIGLLSACEATSESVLKEATIFGCVINIFLFVPLPVKFV